MRKTMKPIKMRAEVNNCGIVRLCFAVFVAIGAAIPLTAVAAATTAPSSLYDLTTNGSDASGSVANNDYSTTGTGSYHGTRAFDGTDTHELRRWLPKVAANMWVVYTFNVPTVVDSIGILLPNADYATAKRAPNAWTFHGSNDKSTWEKLDEQSGETNWSVNEKRYYKFSNTKAYKYYKFNCTANNGATDFMQIQEMEFYCTGTGDSTWTGGGETSLVNDDANWGGAAMPGSEYEAYIDDTGETPATVPSGLTVYKFLRLGNESGNSAKVVQTTGTVRLSGNSTIGRAGATGEYAISGGRLVIGSNLYLSAVAGGKSNGILDISGDGEVELGGKFMLCANQASAGSTACVNISGNGKLTVTGEMDIGTDGNSAATTGTVYQTGGALTAKSMMVGFEGSNYGEYLMSGGNCSVENLHIGHENGTGNIEMTGGNCSVKELFVGYGDSGTGNVEMTGGTLSATSSLSIGRFGYGTFSASGDATVVTATNVRVGFSYQNDSRKGYGTFIVTNGAEVATTKIYAGAEKSHVDRAKVVFDGAVLTATAASAEFLKDLPDVTLGAGGLTINTEGNAVTIANCAFVAEPGAKITVTGGGTVTFEDCTVAFTEKPGRSFAFAETDGVFSGMPAFSNIGGSHVEMSGDNKKIGIVRHGLMIIFR